MHKKVRESRERILALFNLFERTRQELGLSNSSFIKDSHVGRGSYFFK